MRLLLIVFGALSQDFRAWSVSATFRPACVLVCGCVSARDDTQLLDMCFVALTTSNVASQKPCCRRSGGSQPVDSLFLARAHIDSLQSRCPGAPDRPDFVCNRPQPARKMLISVLGSVYPARPPRARSHKLPQQHSERMHDFLKHSAASFDKRVRACLPRLLY